MGVQASKRQGLPAFRANLKPLSNSATKLPKTAPTAHCNVQAKVATRATGTAASTAVPSVLRYFRFHSELPHPARWQNMAKRSEHKQEQSTNRTLRAFLGFFVELSCVMLYNATASPKHGKQGVWRGMVLRGDRVAGLAGTAALICFCCLLRSVLGACTAKLCRAAAGLWMARAMPTHAGKPGFDFLSLSE